MMGQNRARSHLYSLALMRSRPKHHTAKLPYSYRHLLFHWPKYPQGKKTEDDV